MLTLPAPDRRPLANAALPLVVMQVKFDEHDPEIPNEVLRSFQTELADAGTPYAQLGQLTANELILRPGEAAPQAPSPRRGWRLATSDNDWQLTLLPGSLAIETPRFAGFDRLHDRLATALGALEIAIVPALAGRIGLRFVNLLPPPPSAVAAGPVKWQEWLAPVLLGPLVDERLSTGVLAAEQRMVLQVNERVHAAVHSGLVQDGGEQRFLLDIDSYVESGSAWNSVEVIDVVTALNDTSVSLFQHLLSDGMLSYLRGDNDGRPA